MSIAAIDHREHNARVFYVPLPKLTTHPNNVRRTDKRADIEALAASIAAHGLLQNLSVVAGDDETYAVIAGARRLAALKLLAKSGKIAKDAPIACTLVDAAMGAEASLAENVQRVAMHPMDEMEAFAALVDADLSIDAVAERFGCTIRHVEQRLALARLSPKLRAAYRKGEITLDVARAFCLSDDHGVQERLLKQLGKPVTHAYAVRAALTQGRVPITDKLARFVGLEAYEAAGGRVSRDLFDDEVAFIEDPDLLQRLALERADALRQDLTNEGWGWSEFQFGHGQIEGCASERLRPVLRELPAEEAEELADLECRLMNLEERLDTEDETDELWNERDAVDQRIEALRERQRTFEPAQMAHAGAVVILDRNGAPIVTRGLIKRSDVKAVRKLQNAAEPSAESSDESPAEPVEEAETPSARLPRTLVEDLTKARTRALRDQVSMHPHIALALVMHVLTSHSMRSTPVAGVRISSHAIGFEDEDTAERARSALFAELNEIEARLDTFVDMPATRLMDMLAHLVAETLNFTHQGASSEDDRIEAVSDTLASAVDLDMSSYWEVSTEFLERAPKAFILDAVATTPALQRLSDADRAARLATLAKLKKADLAQMALPLLRDASWLPELLETPVWQGRLGVTDAAKRLIEASDAA